MIEFSLSEDGNYVAKHGGLYLTIEVGDAYCTVEIDQMETVSAPPCHDDFYDEPTCPGGKDLDKVEAEGFDYCEQSCPYMTDHERQSANTFLAGETLQELVVVARTELARLDMPFKVPVFNEQDASYFLGKQWRVGECVL